MKVTFHILSAALMFFMSVDSNAANGPLLVMEEFMVPAVDPGISLYVRNKHPQGVEKFPGEKILLYVHGSTYPSETAVKDVGAAVDFILKRRGVAKINLLGWSWGTTIMGWYTAQNNAKVNRLVLYAPQWVRNSPALTDSGGKLGAYRSVSRDAAKGRWLTGVPEDKKAELIPAGWFEAWADATFATDPAGSKQTPPVLRAPNGTVQDTREFWGAGKALYDPAGIRVPTFLAHAEWDADLPSYMLHAYFAKLSNVPYKRYVEIGEGTHTVIMEKNRMQLFQAVQQFLDERQQPNQ